MEIISSYSLIPLVGSIFVIVLGFFVWFKKPTEWLSVLFLLYAFTISIWLFGTFRLFNATYDVDQLFWDRFIYIGVVFIPIFLYHFGLFYCDIKKQDWLVYIGYLLAFFFLPISQTDYFLNGLYKYSWGVHGIAQPLHSYFLGFFFFYFIAFFVNLGVYFRHTTGERRKQVKYLFFGYAILDAIGPLAFLPAYGIPVYPVIFLCAIPFALFLAYAIIKHNALEVKTISVEVTSTLIIIISLTEIFFAKSLSELALRTLAFVGIFIFSILLIRSVRKEIHRREEMTLMASSLEKANIRLQELDRQKTEFLSIASHQLRTPLSILKGYIELIKDGGYGRVTKETKEILNNMDESNEHLIKLVDEFLNISRIEQGRTKYSFADFDFSHMVDAAVEELKLKAVGKDLEIEWKPVAPISIMADEEKIRHVVYNFIDNAIKYSDAGTIKIKMDKDGLGWNLLVQDNGFGFNKTDEVNFFQKFYRGENVKGTNVNGTGLGLFVCRKFIEGHGGRVWAHSPGLGKGSEFGFWIPFKPAPVVQENT